MHVVLKKKRSREYFFFPPPDNKPKEIYRGKRLFHFHYLFIPTRCKCLSIKPASSHADTSYLSPWPYPTFIISISIHPCLIHTILHPCLIQSSIYPAIITLALFHLYQFLPYLYISIVIHPLLPYPFYHFIHHSHFLSCLPLLVNIFINNASICAPKK